jgi:hypothetical protein
MFTALKKMLAGARPKSSRKVLEHIFMFDQERKRDYLMDLRGILRTPGARRALPKLHKLEATVTRNDQRIRIPHAAMLDIVRELALVENRLAPDSPLREVMNAIPGLALSMDMDPMPTSVLMGRRELVPGELSTTDVNLAAKRIAEALAVPTGAFALPGEGDTAPAQWPIDGSVAGSGAHAPPTSQYMSLLDRQQFLQRSKEQIRSTVLRTEELTGADLAAYFDLCRMSGECAKVIDALLPRVAEMPTVWAWVRLLEAGEAAAHPDFDAWCASFRAWVEVAHPQLLPDLLAGQPAELRFGVRRSGLEQLEREELAVDPEQ